MNIRIRKGRIIDPGRQVDKQQDLFIANGRIAALGKAPDGFTAKQEIDASNCLVIPGVIDLCARLREPGQEHKASIATESKAAVSGGVTTICCLPDTTPVLDNPAVAELIHQRSQAVNLAHILPLAASTEGLAGQILTDFNAMKEIGCIAASNGNADMGNAEVLRRVLEYASSCELPLHLFCEDPDLKNNGVAHEGALSTRLGLPAIPATAETVSVSRALLLAEQTGARLHLSRLTTAASVGLVRAARDRGLAVTADVAITHLHLIDQALDGFNTQCHLDPPLRTEQDRQALLKGLADGMIDAVCSDHQPHDRDAKSAPFSLSEAGASTIEHLLILALQLAESGNLTLTQAIAALTCQPAGILGLDSGSLEPGKPADLCIVDMHAAHTLEPDHMHSQGRNTPFAGRDVKARVRHTLVAGKRVYSA
ncbi:MAG: dihydroorotase [Thiotrichales bacterium]|nr:dihydroorotase [Thiotrichales bacterium]